MSTEKSLQTKTKNELISMVLDLESKLDNLKELEAVVSTQEFPHVGVSVVTDEDGLFYLVELVYNPQTMAAKVNSLITLYSKDEAIAMYQAKKALVEKVVTYKQYSFKGGKNERA